MSRNWTPAQQKAIDSRNGTVLVSAAAGSGKTAVLVQRVIERLTDKNNPTPVENLLVVTFTKAAAAEMRDRLSKTLAELIEKNPSDSFLKRQRMFLPNASICTMDSFCSKLVKENFESLDIQPDFSMLSDNEHSMMKNEVINELLDEIYADCSNEYSALLQLFTNGRSDDNLVKSILSIYEFAMAAPYPDKWIEEHFAYYTDNTKIEESIWGKYTLNCLLERLEYLKVKINKMFLDSGDGKLGNAIQADLIPVSVQVNECISLIKNGGSWDKIKEIIDNLRLEKFAAFKADEKDELYFEIKERRDFLKDKSGDFVSLQKLMSCYSQDFESDTEYLRPIMSAFKKCVLTFSNRLLEKKRESNSYYFSDVLHMTLNLLVKQDEKGDLCRTRLAQELSENFDEILIDEFQDTNEAQNFLFDAISKDYKNKFMVGDVKQSIYRFRQANPEIFIKYKDEFEDFAEDNYPAKISLDRNFRSRKGIVDSINFFFDYLMTKKLGDVDYKDGEQLVFAADYSESDNADTQVHIVENPDSRASNLQNEARYIGKLIKDTVESGMLVGQKGKERPIKYSDICILMRAVKNQAPVVARELECMGIPVHYKKNGGFFDNAEIITMLSLLRVIDNPVQDVPLMSTMLSPMFPFTEDDLAKMRVEDRNASIYTLLKNNYEADSKVRYFLDTIKSLRTLSVTLSVSGLIRRIFEITSYDSIVGAMTDGEKRELNLRMLISYADTYEQNGHYGLSGFIRYVDKLRENKFDLEGANTISEADNVVRIMSIHKSKGLEFPVVIVANCGARFNKDDKDKAIVDKDMGIATLRYDSTLHKEFETQHFSSLRLKNDLDEMSETLRVLYVAMTRAREKLFLVGSLYAPDESIKKLYSLRYNGQDESFVPLSQCSSSLQWILLSMLSHPTMQQYAKSIGILNTNTVETESKIDLVFGETPDTEEIIREEKERLEADNDILNLITEKVSYVYPYALLSNTPIKYSASKMNTSESTKYIASENPAFMGADKLTPAQRGTLSHRFMEKCDFNSAKEDVERELCRLVENKVFTNAEADSVNLKQIEKFFQSDLCTRIMASGENFKREQQFTMKIPIGEVIPEFENEEETAIVQGVMDGLIIDGKNGEIIDYKTDRVVDENELVERYRSQMGIYKKAAEECFELQNVTVTLYSFHLSKEISIKL